MRYKNKETGVVINTPCVVRGGNWIPLDDVERKEHEKIVDDSSVMELEHEEVEPVEVTEDSSPDLEGVTKNEIMQELDSMGVEYDARSKKQVLYDLMMSKGK